MVPDTFFWPQGAASLLLRPSHPSYNTPLCEAPQAERNEVVAFVQSTKPDIVEA